MCDPDSAFNLALISSVATGILVNLVWTVLLMVDHKRKIRETDPKRSMRTTHDHRTEETT